MPHFSFTFVFVTPPRRRAKQQPLVAKRDRITRYSTVESRSIIPLATLPKLSSESAPHPFLADRNISTFYQPIVSVRRGCLIGVECLSRFARMDENGGSTNTSPNLVFQEAAQLGLRNSLDWICLERALQSFESCHRLYPEHTVFLNIHAGTIIDASRNALRLLTTLAGQYNIPHPNIALELLESDVADAEVLRRLVRQFRSEGFLVVLDDLGVESSNLDRIALVCPDMIKADRSLLDGISHNFYKQSVFSGLLLMTERIGGWLIAEGIEDTQDALCALSLGGDLCQGYLFGRPMPSETITDSLPEVNASVRRAGAAFKRYKLLQLSRESAKRGEREMIARELMAKLSGLKAEELEPELWKGVQRHSHIIASACLIDGKGIQQTSTILFDSPVLPEKKIVYRAPSRGDSHALKEYFYLLMEASIRINYFETPPYVPLPTADLCVTVTTPFQAAAGVTYVLCLHMRV